MIDGNFCSVPFWDLNQTWYTQVPEFSSCFEDTILVFLPCIIYCIVLLINLFLLPKPLSLNPLPWTWLNISKICSSLCLLLISIILCGISIYEISSGQNVPYSTLLSCCSRVAIFLLVTITMFKHRSCGVTTSAALCTFWIIFSLCSIILYRSTFLESSNFGSRTTSWIIFILDMLYHPIVFFQLFLSIFTDKKKFILLQESNILEKVSFLSSITFLWFTKIILKSRKKLLTVEDLFFETKFLTAKTTYAALEKHWKYYLLPEKHPDISLLWALWKAFWPWIVGLVVLDILFLFALLIPPLLLDRIIDFATDDFYSWRGYFYAALIFITDFVGKIVNNNSIHLMTISCIQLQISLMGALFRKNLNMSTAARKDYPSGNIMSLLTVDVKRIQWFTMQLSTLIAAPLKLILIIYMLWQYVGISALAGIVVMVFLFPISFFVSKISWKYSDNQMKEKDNRLKLMNEILNGIKILKLYAWELPFAGRISSTRKNEIKWIRLYFYCFIATFFIYFIAPFAVSIATFAAFLLLETGTVLDPTKAFVTLTLMKQLKYAIFELPDAISDLIQFNISLKRLRTFFCLENKNESMIGNVPDKGDAMSIREASFSWSSDSDCVLNNIDLHVAKGQLIAIIGPVGSGKSSLLSAILGELYKKSGSVDIKGSIAYVPQQSWVLNRTLRNNILLVKNMVEEKYNEVLDLCCLRSDLEILPAGDETEIGGKGVNLSGGQKLRVNLAQAVYQDKDIYLLDDPLSAVDVHVRKALFNDVISNNGLLKNKTRILVTHDVSILHNVDLIVSIKDGVIDELGTFNSLLENKGSFASFVEEHSVKATEEVMEDERLSISRLNSRDSADSKKLSDSAYNNPLLLNIGENRSLSRMNSRDSGSSQIMAGSACGEPVLKKELEKKLVDSEDLQHRLIEDENMEIGGVHRLVYWDYAKQMGLPLMFASVFFYMANAAFQGGGNVWLSKWSADETRNHTQSSSLTVWRLSIYGVFGVAQAISCFLATFFLVSGSTRASARYHKTMLDNVMKSPMTFFDATPVGRIINRFTTDLEIIDNQLFFTLDGWLYCIFSAITSFVIIGMNTPVFLASIFPLGALYFFIQRVHLHTFRQIKRLESTSRSPVYSLFMESIQGVSSISAYGVKKDFIQAFEESLDRCFVCAHNSNVSNRWFNFFLNSLGSLIIYFATLLAVQNHDILNPAVVGLIVTYSLSVTDDLKWFVRMNSTLEDKSISVERAVEYCHLKPEAAWDFSYEGMPENWPQNGNITFNDYSTRYRENLDLVLKELNLSINGSEKVGIIGRTGAGKSSITLALFRIIEPVSGKILIDDVDITKIGLHNLRSKLTIIPQDPVLFTGSLRTNLDPNEEYTAEEIWSSLEQSYLKTFVSNLKEGLDYYVEENGSNLSAGQRQLVCLARALLKNSKILVFDEATASVDMDTDNLIQKTIRTAFADRTVITIAHRINTVLDYDKIVVLQNGNIIEIGNPTHLLEDQSSRFYLMAKEAGLI